MLYCVVDKDSNKYLGYTFDKDCDKHNDLIYLVPAESYPEHTFKEGFVSDIYYIDGEFVSVFTPIPPPEPLTETEQALLDAAVNVEYLVAINELKI